MKHVVFFSGGTGSWMVAERVKKEEGIEDLELLFTDTLIEDNDLYRFLIETSAEIFGITNVDGLINTALNLPLVHKDMAGRKEALEKLRIDTMKVIPQLIWLSEQVDVWDVFHARNFLGNSRIAPCSEELKQKMAKKYVVSNYDSSSTILYLGIDWTEAHRQEAPTKNWKPYGVSFPLCEEPYINKIDIVKALEEKSIEIPLLYKQDFSHNNCGGFCVRGGQGHFANLLKHNKELYMYHENKEQEFISKMGMDISILRKQTNKVRHTYTLKELRNNVEADKQEEIDFQDIGGCGCFVT